MKALAKAVYLLTLAELGQGTSDEIRKALVELMPEIQALQEPEQEEPPAPAPPAY